MRTLFVNHSGSNSDPTDGNPAHGSPTVTALLAHGSVGSLIDDDVITFVDGGTIAEPGALSISDAQVTFRGYSGNSSRALWQIWDGAAGGGGLGMDIVAGTKSVLITGIDLKINAQNTNSYAIGVRRGFSIEKCMLYADGSPHAGIGITIYSGSGSVKIRNCVFKNIGLPAIANINTGGPLKVFNNTFIGCAKSTEEDYYGRTCIWSNQSNSAVVARNNIFYDCTTVFLNATESNNLFYTYSSLGTVTQQGGSFLGVDPSFVSGSDYHLSSSSPALSMGVSSGDSDLPLDDFDGVTRPIYPGYHSIGAYDISATGSLRLILSHFNGTNGQTYDTAETGQVLTFSGAAELGSGQVKFGSTSFHNNGTSGSVASIPTAKFLDLVGNDFTIDCWVYLNGAMAHRSILVYTGTTDGSWDASDGIGFQFISYSDGRVYFQVKNPSSPYYAHVYASITLTDAWHHLAAVRYGNTLTLYIDGVAGATLDVTGLVIPEINNPQGLFIGQSSGLNGQYHTWDGYIDEVRIVNGEAMWTTDFTPPTSEYHLHTPVSYFDQNSVGDGTSVLSHIDSSALITIIQANVADPYFDSTSELAKVYVYYVHEEGRQQRKVIHDGTALTGSVMWAPGARDGWWYKDKIVAFDHDGAQRVVTRAMIGDQEDSSHSSLYTESMLSHFNGVNDATAYTAETGQVLTFNGTAKLSTGITKFGASSLGLDGGGGIQAPTSLDYEFGDGDFTIDFWAKASDAGTEEREFASYGGSVHRFDQPYGTAFQFYTYAGDVYFQVKGTTQQYFEARTSFDISDAWHHIAAVRSSTSLMLFIDGVLKATTSLGTEVIPAIVSPVGLFVGQCVNGAQFKGNIDELSIVKGEAKWTSNFTPPTSEYHSVGTMTLR